MFSLDAIVYSGNRIIRNWGSKYCFVLNSQWFLVNRFFTLNDFHWIYLIFCQDCDVIIFFNRFLMLSVFRINLFLLFFGQLITNLVFIGREFVDFLYKFCGKICFFFKSWMELCFCNRHILMVLNFSWNVPHFQQIIRSFRK